MGKTGIGGNIARLRKEKHKSAEQLANALLVSRQTVSKWENGETVPNAYTILDIADYLSVSISDIYEHIIIDRLQNESENNKVNSIADILLNAFAQDYEDKKDVEDAVVAFEHSFIPFDITIGFNVIGYEDVLRRFNTGYVLGIKEVECPVKTQALKSKDFIMHALMYYLYENDFLSFYLRDFVGGDGEFAVFIQDEHGILIFKKLIRDFFTGIATFQDYRRIQELLSAVAGGLISRNKHRFEIGCYSSEYDERCDTCLLLDSEEELDSFFKRIVFLESQYLTELFKDVFWEGDSFYVRDNESNDGMVTIYDVKNRISYKKEM